MVNSNADIEASPPLAVDQTLPTLQANNCTTEDIDDYYNAKEIAAKDLEQSKKQTYSGVVLVWLSFQATGVIYGDIGTSPLYVYSSTFTAQPSWSDLVGALSIIIWALTIIVTIKYCLIVLRADDDGQGGTFALYSLLTRYTHITRDFQITGSKMKRINTNELRTGGKGLRDFFEHSKLSQFTLQFIGVLGVSMVMADGVLTPAQSVLGAIQGIKVTNPGLDASAIVGISCAVLVVLFSVQPFGTSKIGTMFAPIVIVWLLFNFCCGVYNLVKHDHTVLKAFSPHYAFNYLIRNGRDGWKSLGGLLLAFTGVEALFADIGAFSKRAVQMSWFFLAFPCLLMAYIGQAAYISTDKTQTAYQNPFFNTVPPGSLYFSLVIAVLAAIVASQAMITSTFQLLSQIMRLSYFPHIKVVHTSSKFHEQVYMPMANWLLLIGTIIVTAVYNNTTALGNAYGVCVISVTFITTCMVALVAILVWRAPAYLVFIVWLFFAALDGAFLSAVFEKVPKGAWFTLLLAFILSSIFTLWRFGKETQWKAESLDQLQPSSLLDAGARSYSDRRPILRLHHDIGGTPLSTVPGLGIFFDKAGDLSSVPPCFAEFVKKFAARPSVVVFFHMRPLPVPSVPLSSRYVIKRTPDISSCYNVTLRHGYADDVLHPNLGRELVCQISLALAQTRQNEEMKEERNILQASSARMVYIFGKETMRVRADPEARNWLWRFCRRGILWTFLWIRENSRTKLADLDIDADKVIEVGFVKDI